MTQEDIKLIFPKLSDINVNIDSHWLIFVLYLVAAALGAYFGAYLNKKAENRAIHEDLDKINNQLQQTTKITEEIKSDLDKKAHEFKFKFQKYHERSIEVIEKLYEYLVDIESYATDYIVKSKFGEGPTEEFWKANKAVTEFIGYANKKSFWIPDDLYSEIEGLAKLLDKHVHSIFISIGSQRGNEPTIEASIKANDEAIKALKEDVPKAKSSIVNSVRKIIEPEIG